MPVRNAEKTVGAAVESIQNQSMEDWELVIVDDGSVDNTRETIGRFMQNDNRIRLFTESQIGIVHALNQGIEISTGSLIARMDADDTAHPDRFESQFSFLNENQKVGLVSSRVNFRGNPSVHAGYAAYVDWTNSITSWNEIRSNRFVESPIAHPSVMFRRSLVENFGGYRTGDFPEDYELWLRWMNRGVMMVKLEKFLLDWHDSPDRLSRKNTRYSPEAFYKIKAYYLADWLNSEGHTQRPIWIWGAGRITRKRTKFLMDHGVQFSGYIDIDPRKTGTMLGQTPVVQPEEIPFKLNPFIISYVGNRGARVDIRTFLLKQGAQEERDFILAG